MINKSKGITLIEMLLVLVIASFILVMGLRQYQTYRLDSDVALLKYNVDTLFSAMSSYFQANCGGKNGTLSPFNTTTPPKFDTPLELDIKNQLISPGYLEEEKIMPAAFVIGGLEKDTALNGYKVRFVPKKVTRSSMDNQGNSWNPETQPTGQIIIWMPEIMVQLQNTEQASLLRSMTQAASCVSKTWDVNANCDSANLALLFSHQVSFSGHAGSGSDYWLLTPGLSQLRDQESSYNPMVVLSTGVADKQFFYCGS